jgi:hypothetical protein
VDNIESNCLNGFNWRENEKYCKQGLLSLNDMLDFGVLNSLTANYKKNEVTFITLLSREYLGVGKLWLEMIGRIKVNQFIVFMVDEETDNLLQSLKVPFCRIALNKNEFPDKNFTSRIGFDEKGLAITALKFPVIRTLLHSGFNVLYLDIDALLLKPLPKSFFRNTDCAFQRVAYHPQTIVNEWGFALCSGFMWFRSNKKTIQLISEAISFNQQTFCDQIAVNLAVWKSMISWDNGMGVKLTYQDSPKEQFLHDAPLTINGLGSKFAIRIRALPATTYWRNDIVPLIFERVILFHPNSPKTDHGKLQIFKKFGREIN